MSARFGFATSLSARLVTIVLVLGAILVAGSAWLLRDSYLAKYERAVASGENTLLSLAHDIGRTIEIMDLSLQAAVRGVQSPDLVTLGPALRKAVLFDGAVGAAEFGQLVVADASGRVTDAFGEHPMSDADVGDRDYFIYHRDHPSGAAILTGPYVGRPGGRATIALSRRIDKPDGGFGGVAAGTIQLDVFGRLFASLSIPDGDMLAMALSGGPTLVSRAAETRVAIPDAVSAALFRQAMLRDPAHAVQIVSSPDGETRIVLYRTVGAYPVGLLLGISHARLYAGWMWRTALTIAALLALSALALWLDINLRREWRRREAAEGAALATAREVRLLTDNASDLLLHVGWDGTRHYVSPGARGLLGRDPAEMTGRSAFEFIHPDDRDAVRAANDLLRRGGASPPIRYRLLHCSGTWIEAEARARALPDHSGLVVVVRDVTEREQLEAKLREAHRMTALGQLTAGVAHDFNNMLQAQLGCLELMLDDAADLGRVVKLGTRALEIGQRGARLTHQLLSFSRQQLLKPEPIRVEAFLAAMAETLAPSLGMNIRLHVSAEPGIAALLCDRAHLESAILNLALNARDAMPRGGCLSILATSGRAETDGDDTPDRDAIVLTVEDDGEGMDAATLRRACEPFFSTKGAAGSGLGLASVQGFAAQSGGGFQIRSEPGAGTSVRLVLPATRQLVQADASPCPAPSGAGRVLLVDDTAEVLETTCAFLEDAGYQVVCASSGEAALRALDDAGPFDCLVTDFAMPGMNGRELARRAQAACPHLATLIITGWAELDVVDACSDRTAILRKPFRRDTLIDQLGRLSPAPTKAVAPTLEVAPAAG